MTFAEVKVIDIRHQDFSVNIAVVIQKGVMQFDK